jgi:hypothetical protein
LAGAGGGAGAQCKHGDAGKKDRLQGGAPIPGNEKKALAGSLNLRRPIAALELSPFAERWGWLQGSARRKKSHPRPLHEIVEGS